MKSFDITPLVCIGPLLGFLAGTVAAHYFTHEPLAVARMPMVVLGLCFGLLVRLILDAERDWRTRAQLNYWY